MPILFEKLLGFSRRSAFCNESDQVVPSRKFESRIPVRIDLIQTRMQHRNRFSISTCLPQRESLQDQGCTLQMPILPFTIEGDGPVRELHGLLVPGLVFAE